MLISGVWDMTENGHFACCLCQVIFCVINITGKLDLAFSSFWISHSNKILKSIAENKLGNPAGLDVLLSKMLTVFG